MKRESGPRSVFPPGADAGGGPEGAVPAGRLRPRPERRLPLFLRPRDACFAAMFFLGVGLTVVGAAARAIGLTPSEVAVLLAAQHLGFALSVAVFGALADMRDKGTLLAVGSLLLGGAFCVLFATDRLWVNVALMFACGVGSGAYEGVTDAFLMDLHPENPGRYIGINHFFVTVGMLAIALYVMVQDLNWRRAVAAAGAMTLALAPVFWAAAERPRGAAPSAARASSAAVIGLIGGAPAIALVFVIGVLAVGMELGTVGFLTSYLAGARGWPEGAAKSALLVFLGGIAAGRLGVALVIRTDLLWPVALLLFGVSSAAFVGLFNSQSAAAVFGSAFVAGGAVSALFPLLLGIAALSARGAAGAALGLMKLAIPVAGLLVSALIGLLLRRFALAEVLLVIPAAAVAGLALSLVARAGQVRPERST